MNESIYVIADKKPCLWLEKPSASQSANSIPEAGHRMSDDPISPNTKAQTQRYA